jgi:E3 ubiquitin-protein ligase TRIP12
LYEIVSIIGEILPNLPQTSIFSIDETLKKTSITHQNEHIVWEWKDEHDVWRPYTFMDSRIVEMAFIQEEDECVLNTMGRTYVIDFSSMLQINEETGTARSVARKVLNANDFSTNATSLNTTKPSHHHNNNNNESAINKNIVNKTTSSSRTSSSTTETSKSQTIAKDYRLDYINKKPLVYSEFINSLFPVLYEVYSSSAGPSIKHKSLRSLLRLIFYSSKLPAINVSDSDNQQTSLTSTNVNDSKSNTLLYNLLHYLPISSHIASMLASNDTKIIVSALQLSEILMQNLPDIFSIYFQREGVIYQIDRLIESTTIMVQTAAENLLKNKNLAVLSSNLADKNKNSKNGQFLIFLN